MSGYVEESFVLACNGRPLDEDRHQNVSFNKYAIHYGGKSYSAVFAADAALYFRRIALTHISACQLF